MTAASVKRLALGVVFVALAATLYVFPLADWVATWVDWARGKPVAGAFVYILFVGIATVMFLPGSVAMMIGGFLFGFLPGTLFAVIAIPIGAQCAFEFGRWVARPWVQRKMADNQRMLAIEAALREQSFLIVVLTRLSLIIPFNVLNYAYGATAVKASTHFFATAVGMLPAVALYVYLGTLARDLGQILSGEGTPGGIGYLILAAGIAAIVVVTWVIHRAASRALAKHLSVNGKTEFSE
jgi:uncharacterized membrane protein YdjX (TVP38/TMEM64 family)